MIEARHLSKRYGDIQAVRGLDLHVGEGVLFGFVGPNGAGKTTTIRLLCGILRPTSGEARVARYDVLKEPVEVKRRIGYLAEEPNLYEKLTTREFLDFAADLHDLDAEARPRIERLLHVLQLSEKEDELVEGLSRGMRQKVGLAAALLHDPQVLFLDEPTSGLDPASARLVKDVLSELTRRGKTIFLSTHLLDVAQDMCDRVGIINEGALVAEGSLEDLRSYADAPDASLEDLYLKLTGSQAADAAGQLFTE